MAFIGVTKAHGPSPQPTACRSATFNLKWKNYLLHPAHYSFTILAIHAIEYWMANSRMIGYTYLYSDYSNFKSEWHLFRKLGYVLTGTNKLSLQIYAWINLLRLAAAILIDASILEQNYDCILFIALCPPPPADHYLPLRCSVVGYQLACASKLLSRDKKCQFFFTKNRWFWEKKYQQRFGTFFEDVNDTRFASWNSAFQWTQW